MSITIPLIFFGVAAFLLNVVLGRLVTAQREQIAALKALGFPTTPLVLHYLKLVVIVVSFGSLLGLAWGIIFGEAMIASYHGFFLAAVPGLRADAMVGSRRLRDQHVGRVVRCRDRPARRDRPGAGGRHAAGRTTALSPLVDRGIAVGQGTDAAARPDDPQFYPPAAAQRVHDCRNCAGRADGRARTVLARCRSTR